MSNIDKRALREAAERAGQNDWEYVYTSDLSAPWRGYITVGGNNMQLFDFAPEVIDIIIAAIIYCGALSLLFKNTIYKFQMRKAKKAEKKSGTDRAGKEGQS